MAVADMDLDKVDLLDPDLFADGVPHGLFARMRAEAPVRKMHSADGTDFWAVTRAEDIEAISKDTETFSSAREGVFVNETRAPMPKPVVQAVLLGMDPPQHGTFRSIVQKVFTPRVVADQEEAIRTRVTRLIDAVIERGECDFVSEIATELPLQTIAGMLGVPHEDRGQLFEWTRRIEAAGTEGTDDGLVAFGEIAQYLIALIAKRRENPQDDLITKLIQAEVDGESLDDIQLTGFFGILMFAGSDTTRNTASGALYALLSDREQWEHLRVNPELLQEGAVEEFVRWVTPVMYFRRTPTKEVTLHGQQIAEGEAVILYYASGSRDANEVEDPMHFDVTRTKVQHNGWGGRGRHFCLGAPLARLQLRVLYEELGRRVPDIELVGAPTRVRSSWVNGFEALAVRFTPGARELA